LNHNLQMGDVIGLPYHIPRQFEKFVLMNDPVEMVVVGTLERPAASATAGRSMVDMWLSFASYEFMANHETIASRPLHLLVVPKEGLKAELDRWLEQNLASKQHDVITYQVQHRQLEARMRELTLTFAATELGIAVVATIAVAVMNTISFAQRREEFGILNALGRSRRWLVLRTVRETGSVVVVAWLISAAVFVIGLLYAQLALYIPKGLGLNLLNPVPWLFAFPIPLVVVLASAGTIAWVLTKLDPVTVIERR